MKNTRKEDTHCNYFMGYSFQLAAKDLLQTPFNRQDNTYHGLCYTVGKHWLERVQVVYHEGSCDQYHHKQMFYHAAMLCSIPQKTNSNNYNKKKIQTISRELPLSSSTGYATSGPQLVYQRPWYVLFCLWKSAYKRSLAAYRKEQPMWRQQVSF